MSEIEQYKQRIAELETTVRHLTNELSLTREESEDNARNYFDMFSKLDSLVNERTRELESANEKLVGEVSERLAAERKIRESENQFRSIIESTPLGIHVYHLEENDYLKLVTANPAADVILDRKHNQLIGKDTREILPELEEQYIEQFIGVARYGRMFQSELSYTHQEITHIFEVYAFQTTPQRMVVMFMDVTERKNTEAELERHRQHLEELVKDRTQALKVANIELAAANQQLAAANEQLKIEIYEREQAQQALTESEERYRLFATNFQGIAFRTDFEWRPVFMHGEFKKLTGYTEEDFLRGRICWPDVLHPEDRQRHDEEMAKLLQDNGSNKARGEYRIVRKNGHFRWVLQNVQTVHAPDGKPRYWQGSITDISETKTAELTLRKAKEMAEEANRMKSRFVFNVSHEIRTPLNGIIGFAEVIHESNDLDMIHRQADIILQESDALLMLVNDLLDHAKIEAGKMSLDIRPLDLFALLENLMAASRLQANAKDLEFDIHVADGVPRYIKGDFFRIRQILLNLVSNSIKFTESGSVRVMIEPVNVDDKQATLRVSVIDTGIGIAHDKQQAIFNSFTQADVSTTRKYGGTGLGTTIARQLVSLMNGVIGVKSEPGQGTTFWFTLPVDLCRPPEDCMDMDLSVNIDLDGKNLPKRRGHILLAEDYRTNQEIVRLHVENAGHRLTIVDNGEMAVEACQQKQFDLILMDLQMPIMDGQQATHAIRHSDTENSSVPILALTASAEASTHEACLKSGMNDIITKPIRQGSFLATVDKWLETSANKRRRAETLTGMFIAPPEDPPEDPPDEPEEMDIQGLFEQAVSDMPLISDEIQRQETPSGPSEAGATEKSPPIDLALAAEEFGDTTLFLRVLEQFLGQASEQMAIIREAADGADSETLRSEAHKLKGGAANLTAMPLSDYAKAIEQLAKNEQLSDVRAIIGQLEDELKRLKHFTASAIAR